MRILYLSPRQCWPAHSGAKLRDYYLLRALSQNARVHFAYFSETGAPPIPQEVLPGCASIHAVPRPAMYTLRAIAEGLLGRDPISVVNYTSNAMRAAAIAIAREADPDSPAAHALAVDFLHLDAIHLARYPAALASIGCRPRVVFNWHNIESEAMRRYSQTVGSAAKRIYARITASKLESLEGRLLRDAFGHIVCSDRERDQLNAIAPGARIAVVENGVDCRYFGEQPNPIPATQDGPPRFVFVGSMDYYPNIDAVQAFAKQVWPEIRSRIPGAEWDIVGARPDDSVRRLHGQHGISVTGTVPDVRPYYWRATASLVPLRTGGGTRLKILESMAAGIPVVSSPLGAEGLHVKDGANILLAEPESAEQWAMYCFELAADPARRSNLAKAGQELAQRTYDWPILGAKLAEIYQRWLCEPVSRP